METKTPTCQNCEKPYEEGFEFCPHCGQKTNEDLTIGVLFYNTISNYFSFDARFLKSFIPLMFRPGYLARKFLEGKRLLFLHPAQMYLFVSVIFFFILSFSTREFVARADKVNKDVVNSDKVNKTLDSMQLEKVALDSIKTSKVIKSIKDNKELLGLTDEDFKASDSIINAAIANNNSGPSFAWDFNEKKVDSLISINAEEKLIFKEMGMKDDVEEDGFQYKFFKYMLDRKKDRGKGFGSVIQGFFDAIPISMFFLLPMFALFLKLFYFRSGTYAHHLVFSFYYFSYLFTTLSLIFGINRFIYDIPNWIDWLVALSAFLYFYIALLNFYKRNWFFTLIKSSIITFLFFMAVIPVALLIIAFTLYWEIN
ncbi:DUF3667 domain-containing protein [Winogradskyella immobilis]|uniref:DUF3667 domain-containing protein n=1 Tax=Winogradskyella immobilis TaxID=2816852 RepID=A0ABS8EMZ1_9FLAO|nr:DUF3667 domain-containing protein [Winogradskyella immobilis]MCC1484600.1 DUF3667 domain-containing protein [Winogradskyella immobilis]MCG0016692.1 DUF3667 domain-containing protein [Winogradskyella immobilis]